MRLLGTQYSLRVRSILWGSCGNIGRHVRGLPRGDWLTSRHGWLQKRTENEEEHSVEPAAGKGKSLGEHIREVGSPAAQLIGFEVPDSGGGRAVVTLQAGPQHANPMGTIHGGILCDIADAAMGIAFSSTLEP